VPRKRKKEAEGHESSERWLITYADMITLLMVFFIVMYSMANTDLKKFAQVAESMQVAFNAGGIGRRGGSGLLNNSSSSGNKPLIFQNLPPRQRDFVSVSSDLTTFAQTAGLEGQISVNMNVEGIIISLSDAMVFEPGSTELRPESIETLHEIAKILKTLPNPIRVDGHTDHLPTNSPLYPTNWELSVARAVSIVRYLAEEEDIDPSRLSAAGYAEFKPLVPNDTRDNREMNRRADIVIIYPEHSHEFSVDLPDKDTDSDQADEE
jgi:chemotaxis protein MotB